MLSACLDSSSSSKKKKTTDEDDDQPQVTIVRDITLNVSPPTYFDFSADEVSETDSADMDIGGTSNETLNFGGEYMANRGSERFVLLLADSGSLEDIPEIPEHADAAPWITNSWDFTDGTLGQPISVGQLWVVYTVEGHYAVMEITAAVANESFTFDYVYKDDGSRDF